MRKLKLFSVLMCLFIGIGQVWATDAVTTFVTKSGSDAWSNYADPLPCSSGGLSWTASAAPDGFESASPSRSLQWQSSKIKNTSFTITNTSLSSNTIQKVSLVASTNSNANLVHISVTVGGESIGSADMAKANHTTYNFPSSGTVSKTGNIVITISGDNNSNTKSFYLESITVTYTSGSGSSNPTLFRKQKKSQKNAGP